MERVSWWYVVFAMFYAKGIGRARLAFEILQSTGVCAKVEMFIIRFRANLAGAPVWSLKYGATLVLPG
jgi:hypothetical protein